MSQPGFSSRASYVSPLRMLSKTIGPVVTRHVVVAGDGHLRVVVKRDLQAGTAAAGRSRQGALSKSQTPACACCTSRCRGSTPRAFGPFRNCVSDVVGDVKRPAVVAGEGRIEDVIADLGAVEMQLVIAEAADVDPGTLGPLGERECLAEQRRRLRRLVLATRGADPLRSANPGASAAPSPRRRRSLNGVGLSSLSQTRIFPAAPRPRGRAACPPKRRESTGRTRPCPSPTGRPCPSRSSLSSLATRTW